jgi:hypothetical protein
MFYDKVWAFEGHSLVKRPDSPNYYITWCQPGSERFQRQSTHTDDLVAAKRELTRFVNERARGRRPKDSDAVSIRDALDAYIEYTLSGRPSQERCRHWLVNWTLFLDREGIRSIGDLTADAQDRYIQWRKRSAAKKGKTLSNATLNRELDLVSGAISAYHARGFIVACPLRVDPFPGS